MSNNKLILVLIAVVAIIAAVAAAIVFSTPSDIAFDPAKGDTRDYRVGVMTRIHAEADSPTGFNDVSVAMQSVMRYRVDAAGPSLKVHVQPRFIDVEDDSGYTMFSSAKPRDRRDTPVVDLMRDGFDLIVNRESGDTRLSAVNRGAWNAFREQAGDSQMNQFEQQMAAPALTRNVPARAGEKITVDAFQGMPALTLTVENVDDDSVTASLTRANDKPTAYTKVGGAHSRASARVTRVHGRMRLNRDTGWIEALTLVSEQQINNGDKTGRMHTTLTMRAVDNPALGTAGDGLKAFSNTAFSSQRPNGMELPLPHSPAAAAKRPMVKAARQPFANVDASFFVDDDHALMLTLGHDIARDAHMSVPSLTGLTLRDAEGRVLDIPLVLDSIGPDYDQGRISTKVRLLPMGWQDAKLDRIANVEARFDYVTPVEPEHIELPLADTPTELHEGSARARAVPTDDGWRLTLTGSAKAFYIYDMSAIYGKDLSARISDRAHEGLTPSDRTLLERVDRPDAWVQQIRVTGESDRFALALYNNMPAPSSHQVNFTSRRQRYANRELPPPEIRQLYIAPVPDKPSLDLDAEPEGADQNRLSLRLPIGVGSACELAADAPAQEGHALVWRPEDQRASGFGIGQPRTGEHPDTERWVLMTDDGVRVYFYGIDVTTTLRCPGQPAWQARELDSDRDKPWLVDIDAVVEGEIDPDMQAARFFDSHRFIDTRGKPVRPMLKHMSADTRLDDWRVEGAKHRVSDYLDESGRIRFWGNIAAVQSLTFSGAPIEKQWRSHLKGLQ